MSAHQSKMRQEGNSGVEIRGRKCLGEGPSPVINLIFQNFDAPAVLPESFQRQIHAPPDQPQCFRVPDVQPWS